MENKTINPDIMNKKSILVIDDDETFTMYIQSLLENDYEVVTMPDGLDAMAYLSKGNFPDLILLDMEMPKMNGRVFARRIKFNPKFAKIPIIFVTSVNSTLIKNSFKNMGIIDFIIKPFNPDEFLNKIQIFFKKEE
jgi:CheY-like chemotaxis protein